MVRLRKSITNFLIYSPTEWKRTLLNSFFVARITPHTKMDKDIAKKKNQNTTDQHLYKFCCKNPQQINRISTILLIELDTTNMWDLFQEYKNVQHVKINE